MTEGRGMPRGPIAPWSCGRHEAWGAGARAPQPQNSRGIDDACVAEFPRSGWLDGVGRVALRAGGAAPLACVWPVRLSRRLRRRRRFPTRAVEFPRSGWLDGVGRVALAGALRWTGDAACPGGCDMLAVGWRGRAQPGSRAAGG